MKKLFLGTLILTLTLVGFNVEGSQVGFAGFEDRELPEYVRLGFEDRELPEYVRLGFEDRELPEYVRL